MPSALAVKDTAGRPVPEADVVLASDGKPHAWGRTDEDGQLAARPRARRPASLTVSALGRGSKTVALGPDVPEIARRSSCPRPAAVVARITDERGGPIPCKVQFIGRDGTKSPDFGPDSGEHAVKNVYYSHDGRFRRELEPGLLRRDRQLRTGVRRRLHAGRRRSEARRRSWRRSWSAR